MLSIRQRLRSFFILHFYRFEGWRWVVLALVGISLFWVETYEYFKSSSEPFHYIEVLLYASLLVGNGLFLELFVRLNRIHKRMVTIMEYKHNLSLEFSLINDWETLTSRLVSLPGRIVQVDEAYLLVNNPISGGFEPIAHWARSGKNEASGSWDPKPPCEKCLEPRAGDQDHIHLCQNEKESTSQLTYSLRINNGRSSLLKFRLQPGFWLTPDDKKIFNNIVDELAVALHVGQDHRRISELQSAEVAMAERRMMSAYVHDQIGQNLGYLHLKLDQLSGSDAVTRSKQLKEEVEHLREIANDSYEIVRDILKKIQPETIPHLTNLLKEHAARVARLADFNLNFRCTGVPIQLPPADQQMIFYAFHEILSNVEKHSRASTVDILVTWSDAFVDISVADNGVGFNPRTVQKDEHFGLEILHERIAQLQGQVLINSSSGTGTVVSISVPILPSMRVANEQTADA